MGLELTPEVLTQKSHEIISHLGYPARPTDTAHGLDIDNDFQDSVEKNDKPRPDWNAVLAARPSMLQYWYRQSPDDMVASDFRDNLLTPGIITEHDPPTVLSGMINLELDPQGRLTYFPGNPRSEAFGNKARPRQLSPQRLTGRSLFDAAGLDPSKLQPAQPAWNSLAAFDSRAAWTGVWPGTTRPLRVEAASFQGKPVFFSLIGDWTKPDRMKNTRAKNLRAET